MLAGLQIPHLTEVSSRHLGVSGLKQSKNVMFQSNPELQDHRQLCLARNSLALSLQRPLL